MKTILFTIALSLAGFLASAQLKGSGKISMKTYDFKNFDKVYFENLDGKLEIEIGKPFSINVTVDDNLENIFTINEAEHELTVSFKDNGNNNNKYIEETHLKIKITMPEASVIKNIGNSNLVVKNVIGSYFRIENTGNGDTKITGATDKLDVVISGNGNINADKLYAKNAKVKNTGNGDVSINVSQDLNATINGNGNIRNIGKAKFDNNSMKTGNGDFINL